ncbi:hypothetical protein ACNOYE_19365 [Nannocystaceae bacterium ST9]
MHALTIDRAALRYRLPESRPDLRGRLDRVRERLFEHALEAALVHEGVIGSELICVRTLRVALRVPEQFGDAALLERWAQALTHAMAERIREADPRELVRYASPIAALTDMARSLVREDRRRAWAWRSLGLIREAELGSTRAGLQALVRALLEPPTRIVALLANLADSPALALRLVRSLPRASRLELLDAALASHGVEATTRAELRVALAEFAATNARPIATRSPEPRPQARASWDSPITKLVQTLVGERGRSTSTSTSRAS